MGSKPEKPGRWIVIEGLDGVGKTSLCRELQRLLVQEWHVPVVLTREPGGSPAAEAVRDILVTPREPSLPPLAELFLLLAARTDHVQNQILPAIARGQWVVCDRFEVSTWVYQGALQRLSQLPFFEEALYHARCGALPDLMVILTCAEDESQRRLAQRGSERSRLDALETEARKELQRAYQDGWQQSPLGAVATVQLDSGHAAPETLARRVLAALPGEAIR